MLLLSCGCQSSVSVLSCAVSWYVFYDCGISLSYLLSFKWIEEQFQKLSLCLPLIILILLGGYHSIFAIRLPWNKCIIMYTQRSTAVRKIETAFPMIAIDQPLKQNIAVMKDYRGDSDFRLYDGSDLKTYLLMSW